MFPQHCFRNNVSSLAGALTPDTCTERVMPGVEFASDCSGDARAAFPEFKMADGGEGGRGKNAFF